MSQLFVASAQGPSRLRCTVHVKLKERKHLYHFKLKCFLVFLLCFLVLLKDWDHCHKGCESTSGEKKKLRPLHECMFFILRILLVNKLLYFTLFVKKIAFNRWSFLDVITEESFDDQMQAYAAGLAEGFLTSDLITLNWENTVKGYCQTPLSPYCERLETFLQTNLKWMYSQIEQLADHNPLWHQVKGLI